MRFTKLSIDGYGRFSGKEVELAPGLQVVAGPNEQGKSTIRHFVGDMLYGQKRSQVQRLYDEVNELRAPWNPSNGYGGRLIYVLDSGWEIEVQRSFDRDNEWVRVYDRTNARDITGEFPVLRNREPSFAEAHIGLPKDVYLGAATISHVSLEDLGDRQALVRIREKLLALTDSGGGQSTTDAAVRRLQDRIAAIGQPAARTRPLPLARARLVDLQKEYEQALHVRREVAEIECRRLDVLNEIERLHHRKQLIEYDLQTHEKLTRAERLRKAEELTQRINEITKRSFELAPSRDFPVELMNEVQQAAAAVTTAEIQLRRTRTERQNTQIKLEAEKKRLGPDASLDVDAIDHETEQRLGDLDAEISRLNDRAAETKAAVEQAEARYRAAQAHVASLPDFSRLAADPVAWFSQLGSSFGAARRARDDERGKVARLRELEKEKRAAIAELDRLFAPCDDFPAAAREYALKTREREEALKQLDRDAGSQMVLIEDLRSRIPGYTIMGVLSISGLGVLLGVAWVTGNLGIYLTAVIVGIMTLFFFGTVLVSRGRVTHAVKRLRQIESEMEYVKSADRASQEIVEGLIDEAGCGSLRELEALYERYRQDRIELSILEQQSAEQERRTAEADTRVEQLLLRIGEALRGAGEDASDEDEVEAATARAIVRYQEYRDAKRLLAEGRDALERRKRENAALRERLDALKKEELALSLETRETLRACGYVDEQKFDSALKAVRGYRMRSAQARQRRAQIDVLEENLAALDEQSAHEEKELDHKRGLLDQLLRRAGAASVEEFRDKAERARQYREQRKERMALEEQLAVLLGDRDLKELRELVEADGPLPEMFPANASELRAELEAVVRDIASKQKEEHALHIAITERSAGCRSLNEIDEERAYVEQRVRDLELELQAASYAATVLEEVTRDRHARVAPHLAALASEYLKEITDGAYDELLVNRDLQISVRIPQTKRLGQNPEKVLSKGTVDQIYLALRLALVQMMSRHGERVPMLLDDPFANYDDERLARAMKLLTRVAETNQILLFTCRQDVVRTARRLKVPVVQL